MDSLSVWNVSLTFQNHKPNGETVRAAQWIEILGRQHSCKAEPDD